MMKQFILVVALAAACFAQHDIASIIQRSVEANGGGLEGRS
jgi:hypothetical protein